MFHFMVQVPDFGSSIFVLIFISKIYFLSINSPISHNGPDNPWGQVHVNPFTRSLHVPPFLHGKLAHSLISEEIIIYILLKGSHLNLKKKHIDTVTYIPVSHSVPVNPFTQLHVNELIQSRQCPPFSQGELAHSLISSRSLQKFISHKLSSEDNTIIL